MVSLSCPGRAFGCIDDIFDGIVDMVIFQCRNGVSIDLNKMIREKHILQLELDRVTVDSSRGGDGFARA